MYIEESNKRQSKKFESFLNFQSMQCSTINRPFEHIFFFSVLKCDYFYLINKINPFSVTVVFIIYYDAIVTYIFLSLWKLSHKNLSNSLYNIIHSSFQALIHDYIFTVPLPCCDCDLPKPNDNLHGFMPNIPSPELEISDKTESITNHLKLTHLNNLHEN